jgi:hypothetical protein
MNTLPNDLISADQACEILSITTPANKYDRHHKLVIIGLTPYKAPRLWKGNKYSRAQVLRIKAQIIQPQFNKYAA